MHTGPPNWIAWSADLGSILGFLATVILAIQAGRLKSKYQRLIRLNRRLVDLNATLVELSQLIDNYTVSSAGIQGWIGSTSGHLKALAGDCRGHNRQSVEDVLSSISSIKNRVTQDALIQIFRGVSEIQVIVERITEDAKLDI